MLVSEVIDRTLNNWLYPAGINRPSFDTLASPLDASQTNITTAGRITIPPDSILEIESELVLLSDSSGTAQTANERGYLETDAATHATGKKVYLDPMFSRKMIFNTLSALLGDLYPAGVYRRVMDSTLLYTTSGVVALPSGTLEVKKVSFLDMSTGVEEPKRLRPEHGDFEILNEFSPPKIKFYRGGYTNGSVTVVVAKDFTLPTTEADDLTSVCGIPSSLSPHLPMGLAGTILRSRELPRVMIEEIRNLLAAQGIQVGSALNVGQTLLNLYNLKVDAERRRLSLLDPPVVERTY